MEFTDYLDPSDFDASTPASVDFYRRVNGGWLDANPVPSDYPAWGSMLEVHVRNEKILHDLLEAAADRDAVEGSATQMVGDFFAAGMDEGSIAAAGLDPIQELLDAITAIESVADVRDVMLRLQRVGVVAFHSVAIYPDFEDPAVYLVYLGQGGLGLPERDYYLRDDERSAALLTAYVIHVGNQLSNLGMGDAESRAHEVVALERRLAEVSYTNEQLRDLELTLNRFDVKSLDRLMPEFGLSAYARELGVAADTVSVNNPGFFEELEKVLEETPLATVCTYLRWQVIRKYASALPAVFEDESFSFYGRVLGGQQQQRERWTRVLGAAAADIGEQVARLYVEEAFSPAAKERCEEMVDNLLAAMRRSIETLDWMTDETRAAALTKLSAFSYKIGYPDEWRDYSGLEIERDSYAANRIRCAEFEYERQFNRLDEPVDTGEWAMPAHVVNAYYNPLLNEIVFPAGILQPPFFYEDADDAVIYGAIGTVIGHEITHGFDDKGSQFDEKGLFRNWWTKEDRREFDKRAEVLVDQFSEFEVAADQKINGRLTLGENIADLGGLAIAYDAFLSTLNGTEDDIGGSSPQQRFFLSYATVWRMNYTDEYLRMLTNVDVHSPNPFRVNGPLSNFPPFAEVFGVGDGSPMRRPDRELVEIW